MIPPRPEYGAEQASETDALVAGVGFDLLGPQLGREVAAALRRAVQDGAGFVEGDRPIRIFRGALRASIFGIEHDRLGRGELIQRFLRDGPYERPGPLPHELRGKRLTVEETAKAVTFIYSFMVNSFKGAVTELLAARACLQLMTEPRVACRLPARTRLYVGDAVMVRRKSGNGALKGADLHLLVKGRSGGPDPSITVAGVVEVKSGHKSARAMAGQLEKHIRRTSQGLIVQGRAYGAGHVFRGQGPESRVLQITLQPSDWTLPRTLRFKKTGKTRRLMLDPPIPPCETDKKTAGGTRASLL